MTASQAADDDVVVYQSVRERPKPYQTLDALHRSLRFAALMGSLLLSAYTLFRLPNLGQVPVYVNFDGSITRWGRASDVTWVWLGLTAVVLLLGWLSTKPHWFNYPYRLTSENVHRAYRSAQQMMIWLTALTALLHLAFISGAHEWPLGWLTGVALAAILIASLVGVIRVFSAARRVSP